MRNSSGGRRGEGIYLTMKYQEAVEFLEKLNRPRVDLAIRKDFSLTPEIFGHQLLVKGIYIHGRAFADESKVLSQLEWAMIVYNETDFQKVKAPEDFLLFHIRDLQEFPYITAIKAPKPDIP